MGGLLSQALNQYQQQGESSEPVQTFDDLYIAHATMHRTLLARVGRTDELWQVAKVQQRTLGEGTSWDRYSGRNQYQDYYYNAYNYQGQYGSEASGIDQAFQDADLKSSVLAALWYAGRTDLLSAALSSEGQRVPQQQWPVAGAAAAATGAVDEATNRRRQQSDQLMASEQASGVPDLGSSTRDPWRWYYGYSGNTQDAYLVRAALAAMVTDAYEQPENTSLIEGVPDQLWELALVDAALEQKLLDSEKSVGPGWGTTGMFQQLIHYHKARKNPQKVIELVERAYDPSGMTSCQQLPEYVWACYKARAFDKLDRVFDAALRMGSSLRNDVDVARIMALRTAGEDGAADEVESRLLAACVRDVPNPHRVDPYIAAAGLDESGMDDPSGRARWYSAQSKYRYSRRTNLANENLTSKAGIASIVGVRFDPRVTPEDFTVTALRAAYQRHGMHDRAAKLFDREIEESIEGVDRRKLLAGKAMEQRLAGKPSDAAKTLAEAEKMLRQEIAQRPQNTGLRIELVRMYMSKSYGQDYAKALEALAEARRIDPACDPGAAMAVRCLNRLNRHPEAVEAWRQAQRASHKAAFNASMDAPTIFYAALSAAATGDPENQELGRRLARQALYLYPTHSLAPQVQELIK
jgi:tetratricopeptide (TPR) repeat protein